MKRGISQNLSTFGQLQETLTGIESHVHLGIGSPGHAAGRRCAACYIDAGREEGSITARGHSLGGEDGRHQGQQDNVLEHACEVLVASLTLCSWYGELVLTPRPGRAFIPAYPLIVELFVDLQMDNFIAKADDKVSGATKSGRQVLSTRER